MLHLGDLGHDEERILKKQKIKTQNKILYYLRSESGLIFLDLSGLQLGDLGLDGERFRDLPFQLRLQVTGGKNKTSSRILFLVFFMKFENVWFKKNIYIYNKTRCLRYIDILHKISDVA